MITVEMNVDHFFRTNNFSNKLVSIFTTTTTKTEHFCDPRLEGQQRCDQASGDSLDQGRTQTKTITK